ncbi:nucleoside diphosphate-linked moiety X motif 19 isoform X1 [Alosa sapidissima]|uniref:nucleoside diphosphate-linked moiety X motif 19 isoform X1 n=1 Tax=Alosa sapidissima TaxID=34773 RepID=UPI001C0A31C6|nr:nucleoside diphosphate-linked moiety X motif 19 isoform X1 [Alosa sapidissima]
MSKVVSNAYETQNVDEPVDTPVFKMNTALVHWKEAATVILTAGIKRTSVVDSLRTSIEKHSPNPPVTWTQSGLPVKSAFDYEVLLLKRSGKSGFMPNAYVFPGGLVEISDFSSEWLDIFRNFTHSPNFGLGVVKQPPQTRPPIFATDRMKFGSPIPGDVAFRICAVRETFEESGILLVVPKEEENSVLKSMKNKEDAGMADLAQISNVCGERELANWRQLVMKNPLNFIRMCRELECLPNIWALHEWGNWLTPTAVYGKQRRYDTAFFICCLKDIPHTVQDEKEIVHFKWSTPIEVLQSYEARELWIAPPQLYDLSRLCHFRGLDDLHRFAEQRSLEGCEQWLPIRLTSADCYISLLPGDGLYPEQVDMSGQRDVNMRTQKSLEELQQESSSFHRLVFHDPYTTSMHINITPKYKHLSPLPGTSSSCGSNSSSSSSDRSGSTPTSRL